jgi:hypothetical protein
VRNGQLSLGLREGTAIEGRRHKERMKILSCSLCVRYRVATNGLNQHRTRAKLSAAKEKKMLRRTDIILAITLSFAAWAAPANAVEQKQATPKPQDKNTLRAEEVKQLLLLMDTNASGQISKEEWLKFMEAEFDRLDKSKTGKVDLKDISQSHQHATRSANTGK